MLNAETRKILKSVNQIREEQECYKYIDNDFLNRAQIEKIFEKYYYPEAKPEDFKEMRFLATSMYEALFTWQYIHDFTYPKMVCRKNHHETEADHFKRRLNLSIPRTELKVKDLFKMDEKTLEKLRRKVVGTLA